MPSTWTKCPGLVVRLVDGPRVVGVAAPPLMVAVPVMVRVTDVALATLMMKGAVPSAGFVSP